MSAIDDLNQRLGRGAVLVVDGGMGSELQARGVPMDHDAWCGLANLDNQELVREVHEDFIRAGADVIITNTYPTARFALEMAGHADNVVEINRRAVQAALQARDSAADHSVVIAGSMSCFGLEDARAQGHRLEDPDLLEVYREQASILAEEGVDLIVLEMIDAPWSPGLQAAAETGLPVWLGPMVDVDRIGQVRMHAPYRPPVGELLRDALPAFLGPGVTAVTVMHSRLDAVPAALEIIPQLWAGPFGAYPHSGEFVRPNWVFTDITPEEFATAALGWVNQGAQLVGGCCGIRPDHIRAVKERVPSCLPEAASRGAGP